MEFTVKDLKEAGVDEETIKKVVNFFKNKKSYKIVLTDMIHPSLNVWTKWHWARISKKKKEFEETIYWLAKQQKIDNLKLKKAKIKIIYYFSNKQRKDKDNFAPKFIMDGLTKAGIITDDNDDEVTVTIKFDYDKKNKRTEILISK